MSINLINIAREHFTEGALNLMGDKVGISPDNIQDVVGKLFPSLLGAVGERAKSAEGAEALMNIVKDDKGGILGDLMESFTGDSSVLQESGLNNLTSLFGSEGSGAIITKIAGFAGISGDKANGLLGLITPILTGLIGKQVTSGELNLSGLQSLMKDQESHIAEIAGDGFMDKLGLGSLIGGLGGVGALAGDTISGTVNAVEGKVTEAIDTVEDKVSGLAEAAGDKVSNTMGAVADSVSGVSGAAGDTIKAVGDKAVDAIGAVGDKASGVAETAGDKASDLVGAAGDKVTAVAGTASDKTSDAVDAAGDTIKNVGSKVATTVGGAATGGNSAASGAKKGGKGILTLILLTLLAIGAFFLLRGCKGIDDVDTVKDTGAVISDGTGTALDGAKGLGSGAVESIKNVATVIGDGSVDLGEEAKGLGAGVVDSIHDTGSALGEEVKGLSSGVVNDITVHEANGISSTPGDELNVTPLSEKVKIFSNKLKGINTSASTELDKVYKDFTADGTSSFLYRIQFQTGETGVPESHQEALIAKLKEATPEATLVTIGYADVRGDEITNTQLSYGRAQEVGTWIKNTLGNNTNIESFSIGETDRFSKSDYSKNRVVEVWEVAK